MKILENISKKVKELLLYSVSTIIITLIIATVVNFEFERQFREHLLRCQVFIMELLPGLSISALSENAEFSVLRTLPFSHRTGGRPKTQNQINNDLIYIHHPRNK